MKIILLCLIFLLSSCELIADKATPVTWGMTKGKVLDWRGNICYMIDLGSIYKPESDSVIFIAGIGSNHENRNDWMIEANCIENKFDRGVGATAFPTWPDDIISNALEFACNGSAPPTSLEHPLGRLNKEQRREFVYQTGFADDGASKLVLAIKYWAKTRFDEAKALTSR